MYTFFKKDREMHLDIWM